MDSLFDRRHAVQSKEPQNYRDRLLIIKAESLRKEFRTPENQLFLAKGGFGCDPAASGRKVFGSFLSDGEQTHFYRSDFVGIIADEHIPENGLILICNKIANKKICAKIIYANFCLFFCAIFIAD